MDTRTASPRGLYFHVSCKGVVPRRLSGAVSNSVKLKDPHTVRISFGFLLTNVGRIASFFTQPFDDGGGTAEGDAGSIGGSEGASSGARGEVASSSGAGESVSDGAFSGALGGGGMMIGDGAGGSTLPIRARMMRCRRSSRAGGRAGLYIRGLMMAPARRAACSRDSPPAPTPKYVRAAASAPHTPSPHSMTLR